MDATVKTYSRRMMPPFSGQLQIAESGDARALSIDGKNWEIQFRFAANAVNTRPDTPNPDKRRGKYTDIASITPAGLVRQPLHPIFDTEIVTRAIEQLSTRISDAGLPYPAIDRFEYWLLDQSAGKPLALLYSCINSEEIGAPAARPTWMAMPSAQLPIEEPTDHHASYVPPVNARLESLIAERAGPSPRAAWFDRAETIGTEFPPCLISEDWEREEHDRLCQLYIRRLAPRLLMLQGLAHDDRQRLEQACRENALDVDRFHQLYPEFIDQKLLKALRVEARLRRSAEPVSS
ncbi:MAG: hypothetical protein ACO3DT_11315 [Gammaproteobacteria bacterium]